VSATTGEGTENLLNAIGDRLRALATVYELFIPWSRGDAMAAAHREGEVVVETTEDDGMRLRVRLDGPSANRLSPFIVASVGAAPARPGSGGATGHAGEEP
jgi:GTP-binding protein HflX